MRRHDTHPTTVAGVAASPKSLIIVDNFSFVTKPVWARTRDAT
jgi:hypothetical protein